MEKTTFEESLKRLEEIVKRLEEGDLPLEDSLTIFEEGMKLSRYCMEKLDEIERKVVLLLKDAEGEPREEEFEPGGGDPKGGISERRQ